MFALIWREWALDRLADVYVAATPGERARVAAGVEAFNARLRADPLDVGESRDGGHRVAFPPLLAVEFRVDVATHTVRVVDVKRYGR